MAILNRVSVHSNIAIFAKLNGSHSMKIVGLTPDGNLLVDSHWRDEPVVNRFRFDKKLRRYL